MSVNTLSLPVDIPWKRLCASEDMIDPKIGDRKFPKRWRSSIAVFSYEPPAEEQQYDDMTVSYLKVACTITGYQLEMIRDGKRLEEVGVNSLSSTEFPMFEASIITDYQNTIPPYFGCYGAILEVAVAPSGSDEELQAIPLSEYPYFMDFEPKRREVYELVSETGETLSRSLDQINVQKGTTTTVGTEVVDTDQSGWKLGGELSKGVGKVTGGLSGESGSSTKHINQTQRVDTQTADNSREKRENFSHTTQLTQMYHQFTAYHLGTNRAVFFMLPRPHILKSPETFVNGPRVLEGIQEVFLVVMRPKKMKNICVEAYLETAHIADDVVYEPEKQVVTHTFTFSTKNGTIVSSQYAKGTQEGHVEGKVKYPLSEGWEIDMGLFQPYLHLDTVLKTDPNPYYSELLKGVSYEQHIESYAAGSMTYYARVYSDSSKPQSVHGLAETNFRLFGEKEVSIESKYQIHLKGKKPVPKAEVDIADATQTLFLTGRGVSCCTQNSETSKPDNSNIESITWEASGPVLAYPTQDTNIKDANRARVEIGRAMIESLSSPKRYARGRVQFAETAYSTRLLGSLMANREHPDNHRASSMEGLEPKTREKIEMIAPETRRSELLTMSPEEQMDRFGLSEEEVRKTRRVMIGLDGPRVDPQTRRQRIVPNLNRMSAADALIALRNNGLVLGDVKYEDSLSPKDSVTSQTPAAESKLIKGARVNLTLSSGPVTIPDIVSKQLVEALRMLRGAGLREEPEISFARSSKEPRNTVLKVTPKPGSEVPPDTQITILLSRGNAREEKRGRE